MSKKRNPLLPGAVAKEKAAGRKAKGVFENPTKLCRLTETEVAGGCLDGGTFWQVQNSIAQAKADQPVMGTKAKTDMEELLEASFGDATGEGEFRRIIAGPPGSAFPVPDEFKFPKHTAPLLVKTGAYRYIRSTIENLTTNRAFAGNSWPARVLNGAWQDDLVAFWNVRGTMERENSPKAVARIGPLNRMTPPRPRVRWGRGGPKATRGGGSGRASTSNWGRASGT